MTDGWVVDASVGIKLFLDEDLSDAAAALFDELERDAAARLFVPDLFYVECSNILWKQVRRFGYPAERARQSIEELRELALVAFPSRELSLGALELALARGISAYDALYGALAERLGVPLVTADRPLLTKLDGSEVTARWLGDLALGG